MKINEKLNARSLKCLEYCALKIKNNNVITSVQEVIRIADS